MIVSTFFAGFTKFSNNLAGFSMHKESVRLDKLVYAAMTILDYSKTRVYDFYYNTLKRQYGAKCELIYTERLLLEIQTDVVYKDMEDKKYLYDTSDSPKD